MKKAVLYINQFFGQIGTIGLSSLVGKMYDSLGFKITYLYLGIFVFVFAVIAVFTLKKGNSQITKTNSIDAHVQSYGEIFARSRK